MSTKEKFLTQPSPPRINGPCRAWSLGTLSWTYADMSSSGEGTKQNSFGAATLRSEGGSFTRRGGGGDHICVWSYLPDRQSPSLPWTEDEVVTLGSAIHGKWYGVFSTGMKGRRIPTILRRISRISSTLQQMRFRILNIACIRF